MPDQPALSVDCVDMPGILPNLPLVTSYQSGWNSIQLAHHRQPAAMDLPEMASPQHIVILPLGLQAVDFEFLTDGRAHPVSYQDKDYTSGCMQILPADLPYSIRADSTANKIVEFVHCYLEPAFLAQIAHESVHPDRVELLLELKRVDLLIYHLGLALRASLEEDGVGSRFYADSMATALSAHLLRHYATRKHNFRDYEDGLPKHKLQQAMDYIQANLGENLSLTAIAEELDMSHYYFCRLFKRSTGVSPHQYLIQQRIERGKELLRLPELSVTTVALMCGFNHQSHFAKHFRQRTGLTPKQFRNL